MKDHDLLKHYGALIQAIEDQIVEKRGKNVPFLEFDEDFDYLAELNQREN